MTDNFRPLEKGLENWHDKYNEDMQALRRQYERELAEQREYIDAQLSKKVELVQLEEYQLEPTESYSKTGKCTYSIDGQGTVYVSLYMGTKGEIAASDRHIATLPEGFRPSDTISIGGTILVHADYLATVYNIYADGRIMFHEVQTSGTQAVRLYLNTSFRVQG